VAAGDIFTIAFYAVLGAVVIGFSVRSWRRTSRSRRAETPEEVRERMLREYEQRPRGGGHPAQWETGRERGSGAVSGCGGGCGGGN
jgi:hypothetical protein